MQVIVSDLSDKEMIHRHSTSSTATDDSIASSVDSTPPTSPLATPSFEPNTPLNESPASDHVGETLAFIRSLQANPELSPTSRLAKLDLPELDLSKPISQLLKVGTQRAHVQAENSEGAAALIKGELGLEEYIKWLAVLWRVYDALELGLAEHASNNVLGPTYDPAVLSRANSLARDITYLLTLLPPTSDSLSASHVPPTGPLPPFPLPTFLLPLFTSTPPALATYLDHLRTLSSSSRTAPGLLAHSYVRYLGDLSGGQFIAARIKKAYDLQGPDGLRFYHFDLQNRSTHDDEDAESRADVRRRVGEVKDWFRKGMDEGVHEDEEMKANLLIEANLAFALNTYLFSLIPTPTSLVPAPLPQAEPERPLRYYEKRALEQAKQIEAPPNTWRERIERFALFGATAAGGYILTHYILPAAIEYFKEPPSVSGPREL